MRVKLISMIAMAISLVLVPLTTFGLWGYFEESRKELYQQPTVCIFQPDDIRVDEQRWDLWYNDAKAVIDEWEALLKQSDTLVKGKWSIEIIEISLDKKDSYNPAGCDINVYFTATPLEGYLNALGWYWTGTGRMEILYIQSEYCGTKYFPEYGFYFNLYCFGDELERPKKMAAVLKHEFGHALGLGHFVTDDPQVVQEWQNHPLGQPSIMTFAHNNEEQMRIQPIDIDEVMKIYGPAGFGRDKNEIPVFEPVQEPKLDFGFSGSVEQIKVERGKTITHSISGYVPDDIFHRGIPAEFDIQFPDSTVRVSEVVVTKDRYYKYPLSFTYESIRGEYKVIVRYQGTEIQTAVLNVVEHDSDKTSKSIITKKDNLAKTTNKLKQNEDKKLDKQTKTLTDSKYSKCQKYKNDISKYESCKKFADKSLSKTTISSDKPQTCEKYKNDSSKYNACKKSVDKKATGK